MAAADNSLKWIHWAGMTIVVAGQVALSLARPHLLQDGGHLWPYVLLGAELFIVVLAALVHGQTAVQRLFLVIPYFLASMSISALMAFFLSSVSHPEAGLIVGIPWFLISLFVFWLAAKLVNRIEKGTRENSSASANTSTVVMAIVILAGATGLGLWHLGVFEENIPPPDQAIAAGAPEKSAAPGPVLKDPLCPVLLQPGKSVGPVSLGMSKEEIEKTGYLLTEWEGGQMPPLFVTLCKDGAAEVGLGSLLTKSDCWSVEGVPADPAAPEFDVFQAFSLKQCNPQVLKSGDRLFYCRRGGLLVGVGRRFAPNIGQIEKFDRLGVIRPGLRINHFPEGCRVMGLQRKQP